MKTIQFGKTPDGVISLNRPQVRAEEGLHLCKPLTEPTEEYITLADGRKLRLIQFQAKVLSTGEVLSVNVEVNEQSVDKSIRFAFDINATVDVLVKLINKNKRAFARFFNPEELQKQSEQKAAEAQAKAAAEVAKAAALAKAAEAKAAAEAALAAANVE